jgi:hypothetical protein
MSDVSGGTTIVVGASCGLAGTVAPAYVLNGAGLQKLA